MKPETNNAFMLMRRVEFQSGEALMTPVGFFERYEGAEKQHRDMTMVLRGFRDMTLEGSAVDGDPALKLGDWLSRFGISYIGMTIVPIRMEGASLLKVVPSLRG